MLIILFGNLRAFIPIVLKKKKENKGTGRRERKKENKDEWEKGNLLFNRHQNTKKSLFLCPVFETPSFIKCRRIEQSNQNLNIYQGRTSS